MHVHLDVQTAAQRGRDREELGSREPPLTVHPCCAQGYQQLSALLGLRQGFGPCREPILNRLRRSCCASDTGEQCWHTHMGSSTDRGFSAGKIHVVIAGFFLVFW